MKENKLIKILIPVIAVLVVFESVMLVSNLEKDTKSNNLNEGDLNNKEVVENNKAEEPVADFIWESESLEMKVGKSYNVTLNLLGKKDLVLDSIETYINFDPKLVTVSKLVTNKDTGEDLKPKIDSKTGLITSILWNEEQGTGYKTKKGEPVKVLSFVVTPKVEGKIDFNLSTSMTDNKFATIIVETNTSKSLAYSSNKLEINVTK